MNLYERDFTKLTPEEDTAWRVVKEKEQEHVSSDWSELGAKMNLFRDYPKAARHFDSLFPNNYLVLCPYKYAQILFSLPILLKTAFIWQ
jgi:hypothetical protein